MSLYVVTAVLSYLAGIDSIRIPAVRMFTGEDVRASGSGNIEDQQMSRGKSAYSASPR